MPTRRARSLRPPLLPRAAASEQLGVQAFREAALPCREPEKKEGRRLLREGDDDGAPIATLTRWGERPIARGERARWLELKTSFAHFGSGKSERKLRSEATLDTEQIRASIASGVRYGSAQGRPFASQLFLGWSLVLMIFDDLCALRLALAAVALPTYSFRHRRRNPWGNHLQTAPGIQRKR